MKIALVLFFRNHKQA